MQRRGVSSARTLSCGGLLLLMLSVIQAGCGSGEVPPAVNQEETVSEEADMGIQLDPSVITRTQEDLEASMGQLVLIQGKALCPSKGVYLLETHWGESIEVDSSLSAFDGKNVLLAAILSTIRSPATPPVAVDPEKMIARPSMPPRAKDRKGSFSNMLAFCRPYLRSQAGRQRRSGCQRRIGPRLTISVLRKRAGFAL